MLWGVTPEGLGDFNKVVGVEHLLRPHVMEDVHLPAVVDPLLKGLDGFSAVMYGAKKGMQGVALCATDVWSYVLDYDDVAPFSRYPSKEYWRPGDEETIVGTDRVPENLLNGFDEAWMLGFTVPMDKPEYLKWTFAFPRPEEVTGFSLVPDNIYHTITKLRLSFEGSDAAPMEVEVKPDLSRQDFVIPAVKATGLILEILETTDHKNPVTGIRNLWIQVRRSDAFRAKVKPLLNLGVLVKYPVGAGGIVVNEMQILDNEITADNRSKQRAILAVLMRNLGARRLPPPKVALGNPSDWPQWRGPNRNNTSPETGLALDWTETPPTELWRTNVGPSLASLVVAGDRVYATGCDLKRGEDAVWCLDAATGSVLWRYAVPGDLSDEYGKGHQHWYPEWAGTHATPAVDDGRIYSLSVDGRILCLDAATGKLLWQRDLERELRVGRPGWGHGCSPLVVGTQLILGGGLTLDKATGELIRKGMGMNAWSSPVRFSHEGRDCLLFETGGRTFAAVTLPDFEPFWKIKPDMHGEDAIDPIVMGEQVLFSRQGKSAQLATVGAEKPDGEWSAIKNGYDTPILYQGYFHSTGGYLGRWYQCYDAEDGSLKWKTEYKNRDYNPTFSILAEGKLIVQHNSGLVEVIKATPESYQPLGTYDLRSKDPQCFSDWSWHTPALSRGRLFCRMDLGEVVALDVQADRPAAAVASPPSGGCVPQWVRADQNMAGPVTAEEWQGEGWNRGKLVRADQGAADWRQWRGPSRNGAAIGRIRVPAHGVEPVAGRDGRGALAVPVVGRKGREPLRPDPARRRQGRGLRRVRKGRGAPRPGFGRTVVGARGAGPAHGHAGSARGVSLWPEPEPGLRLRGCRRRYAQMARADGRDPGDAGRRDACHPMPQRRSTPCPGLGRRLQVAGHVPRPIRHGMLDSGGRERRPPLLPQLGRRVGRVRPDDAGAAGGGAAGGGDRSAPRPAPGRAAGGTGGGDLPAGAGGGCRSAGAAGRADGAAARHLDGAGKRRRGPAAAGHACARRRTGAGGPTAPERRMAPLVPGPRGSRPGGP